MSAMPGAPHEAVRFEAGQVLFREGERSRFVYRLLSGGAEVTRRTASGSERVGRVGVGEYLGEIGVVVATRRSGTASFTAESAVEVLSRKAFLTRVAGEWAVGQRLLHVLSLRTRALIERVAEQEPSRAGGEPARRYSLAHRAYEALRAWLVPRRLDSPARGILGDPALPRRVFARGEILFSQGHPSDRVYWIESGRVRVIRQAGRSERTVGHARRGEFLGEMGVLESMPRTATAVAASKVSLRELPPATFLEVMSASPVAFASVVESLGERARRLHALASRPNSVGGAWSTAGGFFEAVQSVESVSELAERRAVDEARRAGRFVEVQVERGKFVVAVYQQYLRGEASRDDMERANTYFLDYLKLAGVGTLFMLPGGTLTVPLAAKIGKALGLDIFPSPVD